MPKATLKCAAQRLFSGLVTTLLTLTFGLLSPVDVFAAESVSSQGYSYRIDNNAPAWTVFSAPAAWPANRPQPGWHYVLNETQVAADPVAAEYAHVVRQINDATGLQTGANFEAVFDPGYQRLVFHEVAIYRGSERLDMLRRENITLLRREQGLERLQYDGKVSASVVVPGLRVGDRLSYRYTVEGRNPVFGQLFSGVYSTRTGSAASQLMRVRFVYATSRSLQFKGPPEVQRRETELAGALRETTFERRDSPKLDFEPGMAPGTMLRAAIFVSQHDSWNSIARWADTLFDTRPSTDPSILKLASQLKTGAGGDPLHQIELVLDWVQREIRYFGVFFAESSHRPNPAQAVLDKRFGDCKDKAQLTLALLQTLGISARPVLVSQMFRGAIADVVPNPFVFDHVIVEAQVGTQVFWLDPTRTLGAGAVRSRQAWAFGRGLPVDATSAALQASPPRASEDFDLIALDRFEIEDSGKPVRLVTELTYFGDAAEMVAASLSSAAREQAEAGMFMLPDRILQGRGDAGPVEWTRDEKTGAVVVRRQYQIAELFELNEQRMLVAEYLPWTIAPEFRLNPAQRTDYFLGGQRRLRHTVEFKFREPVFGGPSRSTQTVSDTHFRLRTEAVSTTDSATGVYEYETLADVVPLARWSSFSAKAKEAGGKVAMSVRVSGVPPERRSAFVQSVEATARAIESKQLLAVTTTQLRGRMSELALTELLERGRLSPKLRAEAHRQRAVARDHVDDRKRALEDARRAVALDAASAQAKMTLAETLYGLGQFAESLASIEAAITAGSADSDAAMLRGRNRYFLGQFDAARTDFRIAAESRTGPGKAFPQLWYAIAAMRGAQKPADALRDIDARTDGETWPQPLLAHYLGERSERDVMQAVNASKSDSERRERLCEASYFLAQLRLAEGDVRAAVKHFEKAIDTEVWEYVELPASRFELTRIKK